MRSLFLGIFTILLFGCASPFTTPNISSNFQPTELGNESAVFIFSITNNQAKQWNGLNAVPPKMFFKSEDNTRRISVIGNAGTLFEKHILNQDNWTIGRVAAIRVSPGKYQFAGYETVNHVYDSYSVSEDVADLTFTVKPNEIVYIGNVDLYVLPSGQGYHVTVTDKFERDSTHVQEKWPNIKISNIEKRLAILNKRPSQQKPPSK